MLRTISPKAAATLRDRAPLAVDPGSSIAVKRDVHEFVVPCAADRFANVLADLLVDPKSTFGLIRVRRPADRLGHPFQVGERFQGCFSLERAALLATGSERPRRFVSSLLSSRLGSRVVDWLENELLSNYAEIVAIELEPDLEAGEPYRLQYRYLDGTPIAGSNTYVIEPTANGPVEEEACRVRQIFEYQEVNAMALATFQRLGLKLHDQVVYQQVAQAVAQLGLRGFESTVPERYGRLLLEGN